MGWVDMYNCICSVFVKCYVQPLTHHPIISYAMLFFMAPIALHSYHLWILLHHYAASTPDLTTTLPSPFHDFTTTISRFHDPFCFPPFDLSRSSLVRVLFVKSNLNFIKDLCFLFWVLDVLMNFLVNDWNFFIKIDLLLVMTVFYDYGFLGFHASDEMIHLWCWSCIQSELFSIVWIWQCALFIHSFLILDFFTEVYHRKHVIMWRIRSNLVWYFRFVSVI